MIRTLQFKYALKTDGVTAIMLNLYENMDPGQVSFDFLVGDEKVPPEIRKRIEERGGRIYSIAAACREKNRQSMCTASWYRTEWRIFKRITTGTSRWRKSAVRWE